jgi:putative protease
VAKGINYYGGIGVAEFIMETGRLHEGDEVLITGPTTGTLFATVGELRVNLETVPVAKKGERFSFPLADRIRPSDKLYKLVADEDKTGLPVE